MHEAIQEFCTYKWKTDLTRKNRIYLLWSRHLDDRNRAHIYFYSPIPFVKKSADSKTGIEIKGLGEHRISICTPSIHQNKDHNDSNEYRYQLIKPVLPVSLERKQALDMMYHLDSIYLQNGV